MNPVIFLCLIGSALAVYPEMPMRDFRLREYEYPMKTLLTRPYERQYEVNYPYYDIYRHSYNYNKVPLNDYYRSPYSADFYKSPNFYSYEKSPFFEDSYKYNPIDKFYYRRPVPQPFYNDEFYTQNYDYHYKPYSRFYNYEQYPYNQQYLQERFLY